MNISPNTILPSLRRHLALCHGGIAWKTLAIASAVAAWGSLPAHAQNTVDSFTNGLGDGNYNEAGNWSTNMVPDLTTTQTAQIADGVAVTYNPGGDLVIKNGGVLELTSGSFTQAAGHNNYLQLNGGGTVLVDGGTFNQGPISSNPFNVTGTDNAFTVTAGTVNLTNRLFLVPGLTFSQSGGTVNATADETDFDSKANTLSGGVFNATLITGVNGGTNPDGTNTHIFNITGGALTLSSSFSGGIYGGGTTQYINFTAGSTGSIEFLASTNDTVSTVQGFISNNAIEYSDTPYSTSTGFSNFNITTDSMGDVFLTAVTAVPEPTTVLAGLMMVGVTLPVARRRFMRRTA